MKDGFSILLLVADAIRLFGEKLKLSLIVAVHQIHCRLRLILNLSSQPYANTPSVNKLTNREAAPESLQFRRSFPRILQAVLEAEPVQGMVQMFKLGVTYAYHCGTVNPLQVGAFTYVILSAPGDESCIICINLVLPMWWIYSPNCLRIFGNDDRCDKRSGGH